MTETLTSTEIISEATGRAYYIDAAGLATEVEPWDEVGCECEVDWNCGRHV